MSQNTNIFLSKKTNKLRSKLHKHLKINTLKNNIKIISDVPSKILLGSDRCFCLLSVCDSTQKELNILLMQDSNKKALHLTYREEK